ncbi:hypothetical protein FISHEDRAFT_62051 [Fistulina hepatica ATCC 64428]|nr:hypothetical protein FISHEDRAFT_62051 [Fistulina hepatica ATCC 64428]
MKPTLWKIYSSLRFTVYSSLGLIPQLSSEDKFLGFLEDRHLEISQSVTQWANMLWAIRPDFRDRIVVDSVEHRKADDDWCHEFLRIHAFNKNNPAEHRYMDIDRDFKDKEDDWETLRDHPECLVSATPPVNVQPPTFEHNADVIEESIPPQAGQQSTTDVIEARSPTGSASGLVNKKLRPRNARDEVHRGSFTHVTSRYQSVVLAQLTFPGEKPRLCDFAALASTLSLRNPIYQLKNASYYFYAGALLHYAKEVFSGKMTETSKFAQRGKWKPYGYVVVYYGAPPEVIDDYKQLVESWTRGDPWVKFCKEAYQKGRQQCDEEILQAIQAMRGRFPNDILDDIVNMLQASSPKSWAPVPTAVMAHFLVYKCLPLFLLPHHSSTF